MNQNLVPVHKNKAIFSAYKSDSFSKVIALLPGEGIQQPYAVTIRSYRGGRVFPDTLTNPGRHETPKLITWYTLRSELLKEAMMTGQRLFPSPNIVFDPRFWFRCNVKILIVTDWSGGYGTDGFHLGEVLNTLASDPWRHVTFDVTKAHRQDEPTAELKGFRFHTHDLSQYSQIWLFGVNRTEDPLSQEELRALAEFMDNGGGVFATGDHENLGQAMCAEVPRVRSMRRWYYPNAGPNGEPVAPEQIGTGRLDTLMDGDPAAPGLQLDQSDKVPQPIEPYLYSRLTGTGVIPRVALFPHPVLCGPEGVIRYLPDHMHEGLCEVPSNLSATFSFAGYSGAEYPTVNGQQQQPEVIASATTRNTTGQPFGVLAAYDGHQASVGRVLVDATWHHWFNINLMGFVNATNPAHVTYDPAVIPKWEAIKAYFRNVALWLARPGLQNCLRNGGWLVVTGYYDVLISYKDLRLVNDRLPYFWQIGTFAKDALGRLASRCQTTRWLLDILEFLPIRLDPWRVPPRPLPDPPPWLDVNIFETVALGAAIHNIIDTFGHDKNPEHLVLERGEEVAAVARKGAQAGVAELVQQYRKASDFVQRLSVDNIQG